MRIALGIEYDGTSYHGWQAQRGLSTVQGLLEEALSKVANETVILNCAGRTDANVHATGQVVHFDTTAKRHIDAWIWGTSSHLPPSIAVTWSRHVDYSFHARFKAYSRRYRYVIQNQPIRSAILHKRVTWYPYPLDVAKMNLAASYLLGEQDFTSLRSSKCNSKTPMRNVTFVEVHRQGDFVFIDIEANAFLHHMVRNIAGVLMKIGSGVKDVAWMSEVLAAKSRQAAADTAAPDGLYLVLVRYPEPYTFPIPNNVFLL